MIRRSPYPIHIPCMKFVGLPISKIWLIFSHGVNRPGDLDLSISKWGHGSPMPFFLDFGSVTDRHTDGETQSDNGHQCVMPPSMGVGIKMGL